MAGKRSAVPGSRDAAVRPDAAGFRVRDTGAGDRSAGGRRPHTAGLGETAHGRDRRCSRHRTSGAGDPRYATQRRPSGPGRLGRRRLSVRLVRYRLQRAGGSARVRRHRDAGQRCPPARYSGWPGNGQRRGGFPRAEQSGVRSQAGRRGASRLRPARRSHGCVRPDRAEWALRPARGLRRSQGGAWRAVSRGAQPPQRDHRSVEQGSRGGPSDHRESLPQRRRGAPSPQRFHGKPHYPVQSDGRARHVVAVNRG